MHHADSKKYYNMHTKKLQSHSLLPVIQLYNIAKNAIIGGPELRGFYF